MAKVTFLSTELCDSCHRRRWIVQVSDRGLFPFAYCLRCVVGVLRDRPTAGLFAVRQLGQRVSSLITREQLKRWLETEPGESVEVAPGQWMAPDQEW